MVAWYRHNSGCGTHPVRGKHANDFGLYDMSGMCGNGCVIVITKITKLRRKMVGLFG